MAGEHQHDDGTLNYSTYLDIDGLLRHQHPRTDVPDELLFIITHQSLELWFAEALHEIGRIVRLLGANRTEAARLGVARLKRLVELWTSHLDVLDTMPNDQFHAFRAALGRASGLQSSQFRMLELASGLDPGDVLRIARATGSVTQPLLDTAARPSLRHAFIHLVARGGTTIRQVYRQDNGESPIRSLAEELIEYDILFNRWRHRHCLLVMRAIGGEPGTAGTAGSRYLRDTLDKWFFPEIWSARSMSDETPPGSPPLIVALDGSVSADRDLLGGKGWGLQQMRQLGIPVPHAFTLTTQACRQYFANGGELPGALWQRVLEELDQLGRHYGNRFGGSPPLLVSVRSGAPVSMPGMMDTLLNVGAIDGTGAPGAGADRRERALAGLRDAICQVFESWNSERAKVFRRAKGISDELGTAVTVQAMVFGDLDDRSGTGVYMTRDPVTGANRPFGEWLPRAQGEDLVSGTRTPQPLDALRGELPEAYERLISYGRRLEQTHRNVLEIEFTVESGVLYLLQVRNSTSSPEAMVRWTVDLVQEGVIEVSEALARVPSDLDVPGRGGGHPLAGPTLAEGIGVAGGVASGLVVDSADEAVRLAEANRPVILARQTTSTHDIHGFLAANGVLTDHGGTTSHAAVVARQLNLPCVVGCGEGTMQRLRGQVVTIDGTTGRVHPGEIRPSDEGPAPTDAAELLARWRAEAAAGTVTA